MNISYINKVDYLLPNLILKEKELSQKENINKKLKMNNIKDIVEEKILKEYIYV